MENNSNDTLFGFTAITDIFTEQVGNTISQNDDIDDEELERLKQESAKARPATPGSKNKKTEEIEEEEEVEEEEIDEVEEEEVEEPKKSKKASKKKDKEETEEEETEEEIEEETEEDEVESKQVSALFDAIAEELEWDFDEEEEEEKPKTVEELVKYFKEVIEEQSTPEYASEDVAKLDEFVRNGGKLEDYFSITPDIDVDNVDIENENEQKIVLRELLARKGYSDKQIAKKIERFEDAGVLEDEARDAVEELQEIVAKEKEELLEQQRIKKEEMVQRQQKFFDDVVGEIKSLDPFVLLLAASA